MNIIIPRTQQAFVLIYQDENEDCLLIGIVGDPFEGRAADMRQHPDRIEDRYHIQELFSSEWVRLKKSTVWNGAGVTSQQWHGTVDSRELLASSFNGPG
jgi:hypothetical protein